MAEHTRDLNSLARRLMDTRIESTTDVRDAMEGLRVLQMEVAEVTAVVAKELYEALRYADNGKALKARHVVRPLRHAESLNHIAARRCIRTYRLYLKVFAEIIRPARNRGTTRKFEATK